MIMTMVVVFRHAAPQIFVTGDAHATFSGGDGLDRVQAEGADITK